MLRRSLIDSTVEHTRDVRRRIVPIEPALRPENHTPLGVFGDPFCETPIGVCFIRRGHATDWLFLLNERPQSCCVTPVLVLFPPNFNHARILTTMMTCS